MPLHEVVTQVVMLLHVEAERAKVALEVAQIDTLPDVSIDPLQIEQVLLNVILNAIQATSAGGRIVIREYLDRRDALVDVVDEGAGIATEHLSSIFSPFFTTREKGTGLGLAIAHRIVMAHDGRIEVPHTSAAGTCFRIRLPLGGPSRSALQPLHSEAVV